MFFIIGRKVYSKCNANSSPVCLSILSLRSGLWHNFCQCHRTVEHFRKVCQAEHSGQRSGSHCMTSILAWTIRHFCGTLGKSHKMLEHYGQAYHSKQCQVIRSEVKGTLSGQRSVLDYISVFLGF